MYKLIVLYITKQNKRRKKAIDAEPLQRTKEVEVDIKAKYYKIAEDMWTIIFWLGVFGYFYFK